MEIKELLIQSKKIWGREKRDLPQIIIRLGTIFGDICRWERNYPKDKKAHTEKELKKELGNMIFSTVQFCDDLGFDPEDCVKEAIKAQIIFQKSDERFKRNGSMEISGLLQKGKAIWNFRMDVAEIIVAMGKVLGDICRWERNVAKDRKTHTKKELKKELGNIIFSSIRWCDSLGFDPEECIKEAIISQRKLNKL